MTIKSGDTLPLKTTFQKIIGGEPTDVKSLDVFGGKKVVVVTVPGAMTPVCNNDHLPAFIKNADAFKEKGVDSVVCICVNDAFVVSKWGEALEADGKVEMLADGGANFAKALGMEVDTGNFGGLRFKRASMLVDDGKVIKVNVEKNGLSFDGISSADTLLKQLDAPAK